ncbi:MAG: MarR family transcriptional regulator [Dorea sp.]|nr:MarR family transcriptional regulator [Dorea sp.]
MQECRVCSTLIKQIHDEMEKRANNSLRSQDLTMAQVGVLMELYRASGKQLPLKELEHRLHVAQSTAAGIVVRMEQKRFVESFGSPGDRRIKMVKITADGEACCLVAEQQMKNAEEELLAGLTETERSIFLSLLQKVCDTLI